jgi:HAD superfamily hydrolase (TIGR01509 family)
VTQTDPYNPPILLFDVMDTLVHDPFYDAIPAFFDMTMAELLDAKDPDAWPDFETGKIDEKTFLTRFFADGRAIDPVALKRCLMVSYQWLDGVEEVLDELSGLGVPMHALSNYPTWYRLIERKLSCSRYFNWSFVSCVTGFRKPARTAYEHALSVLGVSAGRCIFIDDRASNCDGAREAGLRAIHFTDAGQLRGELERLGAYGECAWLEQAGGSVVYE